MIAFDNSYARLPERFFARQNPAIAPAPRLVRLNLPLADLLGLDPAALTAEALSGAAVPPGAEPLAMAYAGHQFGGWVPQLGDGRAILLGEVIGRDGLRRDIQLKGAGRTPFSRGGDGKATLGPALREYLISEAMHALRIPTTRSLAVALTGESVRRESLLPGAVVTRVAASHIRVGTFQFFAGRGDVDGLRALADYALARHYPDADGPAGLLDAVIARTAALVARWLGVGFIHGVMNTDNMSIAGETIDYGPCAFMDDYHPATVFSSIDHAGRYAFAAQPRVAHWNLAQLASALLPLLATAEDDAIAVAQAAVNRWPALFDVEYLSVMRAKLGLATAEDGDAALIADLLRRMAEGAADYTLTFRAMAGGEARAHFADPALWDGWAPDWRARLAREGRGDSAAQAIMRAANPAFIPRNHRVEAALAAAHADDFAPADALQDALSRPYDDQPEHAALTAPPEPGEEVRATFCGT